MNNHVPEFEGDLKSHSIERYFNGAGLYTRSFRHCGTIEVWSKSVFLSRSLLVEIVSS